MNNKGITGGKNNRSVLLPDESYDDYVSALAKSGMDRRHFDWQRLQANGWTKEQELEFQRHCQTCGFILPSYARTERVVGKNPSPLSRLGKPVKPTESPQDQSEVANV